MEFHISYLSRRKYQCDQRTVQLYETVCQHQAVHDSCNDESRTAIRRNQNLVSAGELNVRLGYWMINHFLIDQYRQKLNRLSILMPIDGLKSDWHRSAL